MSKNDVWLGYWLVWLTGGDWSIGQRKWCHSAIFKNGGQHALSSADIVDCFLIMPPFEEAGHIALHMSVGR